LAHALRAIMISSFVGMTRTSIFERGVEITASLARVLLFAARSSSRPQKSRFAQIFSREPFKGLKAILDCVSSDQGAQYAAVNAARSYEELLSRLGYRITLTNQIHVQDCYSRVSAAGGIKAVLPCYDIPTQSSLPTLVNLDSTVTTTPKAAAFFNKVLAALKTQLSAQS